MQDTLGNEVSTRALYRTLKLKEFSSPIEFSPQFQESDTFNDLVQAFIRSTMNHH